MPAEWENESAILLAWPHEDTDWRYMLADIEKCYIGIIKSLSVYHHVVILAPDVQYVDSRLDAEGVERTNVFTFRCETNDTWIRDYGPLTLKNASGDKYAVDFAFNAWGMKFASNYDNLATSRLAEVFRCDVVDNKPFVLEGGSIESDGHGAILTTESCLLSANRNEIFDRETMERELGLRIGARRVLWLSGPELDGDDTDGHVDTVARFAPYDTIIYCGAGDADDEQAKALRLMVDELHELRTLDDKPFNLVELPLPDASYDAEGHRLPATYANYLVTDKAVFVPQYGNPMKDDLAMRILNAVYERPAVGIDCGALIQQHGSLHCATMQIPLDWLSFL